MLANLDPAIRSRVEAINLVALFKSNLLDEYSLDDILKPFINDLQKLNSVSYTSNLVLMTIYHCISLIMCLNN